MHFKLTIQYLPLYQLQTNVWEDCSFHTDGLLFPCLFWGEAHTNFSSYDISPFSNSCLLCIYVESPPEGNDTCSTTAHLQNLPLSMEAEGSF